MRPNADLNYSTNETMPSEGIYIDLGSISFDDVPLLNDNGDVGDYFNGAKRIVSDVYEIDKDEKKSRNQSQTDVKEWRAKHWIVIVDDEPAIRLAIGDYLYSMGYIVVTACADPLALLEVLLWSCSWSFFNINDGDKNRYNGTESKGSIDECSVSADTVKDETEVSRSNKIQTIDMAPPPWIGEDADTKWRLPHCIISDVRMPETIDTILALFSSNHEFFDYSCWKLIFESIEG